MFDLVIADATLRGRPGTWHIGIDGARVAALETEPLTGRVTIEAGAGLVTESFVNAHLHLDKVHTLDRIGDAALTAYTADGMAGAAASIDLASSVKSGYDRGWIKPQARRVLLDGIRYGVRHVLAFADVDTAAGLEGVVPLLELREELRGVIDLQVGAFPQDGLLRDPGAEELVVEAVRLGVDAVGGIPWIEDGDSDQREHVRRMCGLAAAHGRRVAMLVDDSGDPALDTTAMLAEELLAHDLVGRGVANHARALGRYDDDRLDGLVALARRAGSASAAARTRRLPTFPSNG
ncbi:MAG: hypothetical protein R2731_11685 [Nocardioides sp.]